MKFNEILITSRRGNKDSTSGRSQQERRPAFTGPNKTQKHPPNLPIPGPFQEVQAWVGQNVTF